ncbi:uncharacterized protein V1516DRAFT_683126 [Lipomyces oligophaga]|uniref:uncharacterized protein n=1 Tax=Lipomyces oligophaga TaxID=45792 RepID=UPI0034CD98AC
MLLHGSVVLVVGSTVDLDFIILQLISSYCRVYVAGAPSESPSFVRQKSRIHDVQLHYLLPAATSSSPSSYGDVPDPEVLETAIHDFLARESRLDLVIFSSAANEARAIKFILPALELSASHCGSSNVIILKSVPHKPRTRKESLKRVTSPHPVPSAMNRFSASSKVPLVGRRISLPTPSSSEASSSEEEDEDEEEEEEEEDDDEVEDDDDDEEEEENDSDSKAHNRPLHNAGSKIQSFRNPFSRRVSTTSGSSVSDDEDVSAIELDASAEAVKNELVAILKQHNVENVLVNASSLDQLLSVIVQYDNYRHEHQSSPPHESAMQFGALPAQTIV